MADYEDPTVYAKYLKHKITHSHGCDDCGDKTDECTDKCSCCPPGLVSVPDENGVASGCLTPADAELYRASLPCGAGFVKLYRNAVEPPEFLGCVAQADFEALYTAVNPA